MLSCGNSESIAYESLAGLLQYDLRVGKTLSVPRTGVPNTATSKA